MWLASTDVEWMLLGVVAPDIWAGRVISLVESEAGVGWDRFGYGRPFAF
jgi:hypothetical protein